MLKFLNDLYSAKKITLKTFRNLSKVYAFEGAPELKNNFDILLTKIECVSTVFKYKEELAAKVLLAEIAEEEIQPILNLYKNFPYSLNLEDLEIVYFKYSTLPEGEILKIFKAILTRLPYKEEPYENLALAIKILKDGREEVFNESLKQALIKQDKLKYMKALTKVPFFIGYQDELTLKFYGKKDLMDVGLEFKALLQSLPFNSSYKENADIGIKVLLGKIPYEAGYAQAVYRKENKGKPGEDPLRLEALQKYSGPKSKEEVLEFFRLKLKPYTFYKNDGVAYCAALSYLIDELNGKIPPKATTVALELFEPIVKKWIRKRRMSVGLLIPFIILQFISLFIRILKFEGPTNPLLEVWDICAKLQQCFADFGNRHSDDLVFHRFFSVSCRLPASRRVHRLSDSPAGKRCHGGAVLPPHRTCRDDTGCNLLPAECPWREAFRNDRNNASSSSHNAEKGLCSRNPQI